MKVYMKNVPTRMVQFGLYEFLFNDVVEILLDLEGTQHWKKEVTVVDSLLQDYLVDIGIVEFTTSEGLVVKNDKKRLKLLSDLYAAATEEP